MGPKDRKGFRELIEALAAAFNAEVSEALFTGYWMGLQDLQLSDLRRAGADAIRDCQFMPKPAELRELAGAGKMSHEDRAVIAWDSVCRAVERHGYYETVQFDDPVTTATLRSLWHTWVGVDNAFEQDQEKWLRKEFTRVYCAFSRRGVKPSQCRPLIGYYDQQNSRLGLQSDPRARREVLTIQCGLPTPQITTEAPKPKPSLPPEDLKQLTSDIGKLVKEAQ